MSQDELKTLIQDIKEAGITIDQMREAFDRMKRIQLEGGFGVVSWIMKRGQVYQIEHTVHGKPAIFSKTEREDL